MKGNFLEQNKCIMKKKKNTIGLSALEEQELLITNGGGFWKDLGDLVATAVAHTLMGIENSHDKYNYGHAGGARP